ncbi:AsmA family protein [Pseudomonas sp. gcc21]|uniref:AsmA family protein n=1 Tax=Pseudomonas sp. gcc21 TaxID=2726989 RepID=UPI0014529DFD|nr:AsmA family protein [Pseudomonas sp. gcc21]QJD59515.1 AsmA family protein [Pseudomonas sp. gcc21]
MKALKIVGLVVFGLLVLGVGLLFFLTRIFDPNDYKENIQQAAREHANVELTLEGDIAWSLFPWLGIELEQVGVAPLDQPDQQLAQVGSMGLGVKVLPLLRKQLRMDDVILDSVTLNLVRNQQGVANWESIGASEEVVQEEGATTEAEPEQGGTDLDIAIESVRITNANVRYTDEQAGQSLQMEDINLTTGALIEGESFDVEFLGLLIVDDPALRVRMDLNSVARFDLSQNRYELEAIDLKVDASGTPFSGRAVNLELQGNALVDLTEQIAELNEMRLTVADMRATGQLKATDLDGEMKLTGNLDAAEFDGRKFIRSLGQELPETSDPRALEAVALSANIDGSANSLMLNDLKLVVDGSELTGNAGLADFERQALRFNLTGNTLNIDKYLPAEEEPSEDAAPTPVLPSGGSRTGVAPPAWSDEAVLPLETLATLDIDGQLSLQEVIVTGLTISPFEVSVLANDGVVQLRQLSGGVFGGEFSAQGEINTRSTPTTVSIEPVLTGIDSLALQEAYEQPPQIRGLVDLNANLQAQGNSIYRWMDTLDGNASFTVNDGALVGVNLEQQLCRAIALANRKALSESRGGQDTPFRSLQGSFNIENGQVRNEDLVVALPGIAAKGRGSVNLPQQKMDYRIGLEIQGDTREMPDPACQVNERYAGIEWPIRCEGFLHNAASSCGVDGDGVAKIAGRLIGDEAKRKVEEKLEDKLGEQAPAVRDALRGLLGR